MTTLIAEARHLYSVKPAEFIAARNERARALTTNSEKELASQLKRFARPSVAAWSLNLYATAHWKEFAAYENLRANFLSAQADPDRETMVSLDKARRTLVAATLTEASRLASAEVVQLTSAAAAEITRTVRAAIADAGALTALFSGTLIHGLESDGVDEVDLSGAFIGDASGVGIPRPAKTARTKSQKDQERAAATKVAAKLRAASEAAIAEFEQIDQQADELTRQQAALATELAEAERQVDLINSKREALAHKGESLARDRARALSDSIQAQKDADVADRKVEQLR